MFSGLHDTCLACDNLAHNCSLEGGRVSFRKIIKRGGGILQFSMLRGTYNKTIIIGESSLKLIFPELHRECMGRKISLGGGGGSSCPIFSPGRGPKETTYPR